ncbi:MAG: hypothetical protein IJS12_07635 [Lachnospiraceae bacterium]|nr:hypothetical protein [Lachnospiraceae bacterium]
MKERNGLNIKDRIRKDPEVLIFGIFLACMCVYYSYRMFAFAPWYDELYTYNFFVSRGPVYAGIHWPVPNNHLGYSALSGVLYVITHDPYISLRGIAWLSSIGNLIMLYMTGRYLMKPGMRLLLPAIYAGAWQVNNITVQGRGYSLSVNMMLIAFICLLHLCFDESDGPDSTKDPKRLRKYYILWAIALILGFYTVITTLYWVVTLCLSALFCLLSVKRADRLIRLIISSVCGAVGTLTVYSAVWLAIGSNLLIKDKSGLYSQLSHLALIRSHPVLSLKTGAEYMLATPYIQSVDKTGYPKAFFDHWIDILNHMYSFGVVILVIMLIGVILAAVTLIARHKYLSDPQNAETGDKQMNEGLCIFSWLVICFAFAAPITVFVQIKLPYIRVFTFYAVAVSLGVTYVIYVLFGALKGYFTYGIGVIVTLLVIAQILSSDYNIPYGEREEAVSDLMKQADLSSLAADGAHICLTDVNQEYMYRFLYDEYPEMADISEADVIVIDKDMLDPEAEFHWEFYYDHDSVDMDRLSGMKQLLRNTYYEVYITDEISDKISVVR